jgi:xanthine dehydrogenase small subunit
MLKQINADNRTIEIHAGNQIYLKPFTIDEALRIRKESPSAILIAGSTDVALRQTKKRELLPIILDISGIEDLRFLDEKPDSWELGAGLSLETVRTWSMDKIPALYNILGVFGSLQIRNIATLGGNIGSASPIGDTLPLLLALKASIRSRSSTDERITPIEQFIVGYRKTSLHSDELITTIIIPKPAAGTILWTYKVSKRKDLDISTVSAAFSLTVESGIVSEIILAFGGMAEKPVRACETEQFLHGKLWNRGNIEKAMNILEQEFNPISDARAGAAFRRIAAKNLLMKFYTHDC